MGEKGLGRSLRFECLAMVNRVDGWALEVRGDCALRKNTISLRALEAKFGCACGNDLSTWFILW